MRWFLGVILFVAVSVEAAVVAQVRWAPIGYDLVLFNDNAVFVGCRVTASNGALYDVRIPPQSWSLVMRINDPNAIYNYNCWVL